MIDLSLSEQEFMKKKYFASLSVISPKTGLPHVTTVWAHYQDGKFYVISNKATAKYRFIENGSNKVGLNIPDPKGFPYISVNGEAKLYFENDRDDFWDTIITIIKKYNNGDAVDQWLKKMKDAGNRFLLEIDPINLFSTA